MLVPSASLADLSVASFAVILPSPVLGPSGQRARPIRRAREGWPSRAARVSGPRQSGEAARGVAGHAWVSRPSTLIGFWDFGFSFIISQNAIL
jgi:hypothetical protein